MSLAAALTSSERLTVLTSRWQMVPTFMTEIPSR
jgi:hypothetical protein